jgi:acetoin:2,6-dichlorophenolindophenol oxidoreductase subunit alpha
MFNQNQLIDIYKTMCRIRFFEEKSIELYRSGSVTGSVHLYIGQEAIAATMCALLDKTDMITSTHRGLGHCIAKGGQTGRLMAELFGRSTGYCHGKGGSMHISQPENGNLGCNGMVGGGFSLAVGAGITSGIVKKNGTVTVCFFGEGASNEGTFHEALNLAAVWHLPVVFVCENNLYQVFTSIRESCSVQDIALRAGSYGIPGVIVDGNSVSDMEPVFREAIARARRGEGPTLIECKTYRYDGHYPGDTYARGGYRSVEEVEEWLKKDPIAALGHALIQQYPVTQDDLNQIQADIRTEISQAVEYAANSPWPEPGQLLEGVFCTEDMK